MSKPVPFTKYSDINGPSRLKFVQGTSLPVQLKFQKQLEKNTPCYYLRASGSKFDDPVKQKLSSVSNYADVRVNRKSNTEVVVTFGDRDPFHKDHKGTVETETLTESLFGVQRLPDVSIDQIGYEYSINGDVSEYPVFQDSDKVAIHYEKRGLRGMSANRRYGIELKDMLQLKWDVFRSLGLVTEDQWNWFTKKEQSRLVTLGVITDDGLTHEDIVENGSVSALKDLLKSIHSEPWKDVAVPRDFSAAWNEQQTILYELEQYDGEVSG